MIDGAGILERRSIVKPMRGSWGSFVVWSGDTDIDLLLATGAWKLSAGKPSQKEIVSAKSAAALRTGVLDVDELNTTGNVDRRSIRIRRSRWERCRGIHGHIENLP